MATHRIIGYGMLLEIDEDNSKHFKRWECEYVMNVNG